VLSSATKLFFENIHNLPSASKPRIIGVTGTKGKGTTSTLIAEILRAAGFRTILAGNIGKPMLDALGAAAGADFVVLELSSFQLQDLRASPDIAVVLDVFPDHLDAHGSTHEYLEAKSNIGRHQRARDALFYFAENPLSRRIAAQSDARKFSVRAPDTSLKNFKMAEAVTSYLGVGAPVIQRTIAAFTGLEHRLEIVRRTARLTFVNDSAATNPAATALAVRSFPAPIVLIAGGRNKGLNYAPLGRAIRESSRVSAAVLFGENREELKRMLRRSNPDLHVSLAQDLREATRQAVKFARTLHATPEHRTTVLFSPASASFDQFESYVDRGDQFKRIVRKTSIGKE
jgi:UDP-N-acetylmuramoylalanine--D-glutamate ligase